MSQCPKCSAPRPSNAGKFCPRCGHALGPAGSSGVVHVEKRGTLLNASFITSVVITVTGGLLAGGGLFVAGGILLAIGVPSLLVATVRSLSR